MCISLLSSYGAESASYSFSNGASGLSSQTSINCGVTAFFGRPLAEVIILEALPCAQRSTIFFRPVFEIEKQASHFVVAKFLSLKLDSLYTLFLCYLSSFSA
jgi:hypothetical protein